MAAVLAVVAAFVVHTTWERTGVTDLLAWALLCAGSNLLPVPAAANVYLSMSGPVNVAIALVLPPSAAATVVFAASVSEWELRRQTSLLHALFNRAQLALATAAAAAVFAVSHGDVPSAPVAVGAVAAYQALNWLLVAGAERTARGTPLRRVLASLLPPQRVAALTYLVLGLMGVALGLAYVRIGAWAVPLLMVPLVGARYAVQASQDVEQLERERRRLADRLVAERERERLRVASEIHDIVLQKLAAAALEADNVVSALEHEQGELASRLATRTKGSIADVIADLRGAIAGLRHASVDADGLVPAIARFARAFGAETGLDVTVRSDGFADVDVAPSIAILVYECCQEGLVNVAQHAEGATCAEVAVTATADTLALDVTDDGAGVRSPADAATSVGLTLLREKLAFVGGSLRLEALPSGGTRLSVRLRSEAGR